jgi:dihydropteroate synthase
MGILNVTPDSFSDGGAYLGVEAAVAHALQMAREGADIIDIGGESSRPGAVGVSPEEELRRVLPVIHALSGRLTVPISIDTTKASVARRAVDAGASIINDISGRDPGMLPLAAASGVGLVIMHAKGTPQTMQRAPRYHNLMDEVTQFLRVQVDRAVACGVPKDRIVIDPGIGFGKTARHNLQILNRLPLLTSLELPILVGPSRKSFIGKTLRLSPTSHPSERVDGTDAALAISILHGARIVRVHDVASSIRVVRMADAIQREKVSSP